MTIHVPMWLVWSVLVFVGGPISLGLLFWLDDARRVWADNHAKTPAWRIALLLSLVGFLLAGILGLVAVRFDGPPAVEFVALTMALASVLGAAFGGGLLLLAALRTRIVG